jgi:hypothetical protein
VTNTNVLYGLRASNFFQSAGRALLLASRFHGRVPSLHAQDLVWVFVHRFLSKVLKAPDSCLVSVYDLVPTCIGQCHIIALEVQCLFKTSFSRAVPTCWIYNVEAPLEGIWRALPYRQRNRCFWGGGSSDTILETFSEGIGNPCSARKLPFFLISMARSSIAFISTCWLGTKRWRSKGSISPYGASTARSG